MPTEVIVMITQLAITIAALFVAKIAVPYVKVKIGAARYDMLVKLASEAIRWAEVNVPELQTGPEKKKRVVEYLKSKGFDDFDEATLDILIDSAVHKMNEAVKGKG